MAPTLTICFSEQLRSRCHKPEITGVDSDYTLFYAGGDGVVLTPWSAQRSVAGGRVGLDAAPFAPATPCCLAGAIGCPL